MSHLGVLENPFLNGICSLILYAKHFSDSSGWSPHKPPSDTVICPEEQDKLLSEYQLNARFGKITFNEHLKKKKTFYNYI